MKKLPKIYQQEIDKKITNNYTVYYSTTKQVEKEQSSENIKEFINNLIKEGGYIFNKPLIMKTKEKIYDTAIVKITTDYIYTLSDDKIRIGDITFIQKK